MEIYFLDNPDCEYQRYVSSKGHAAHILEVVERIKNTSTQATCLNGNVIWKPLHKEYYKTRSATTDDLKIIIIIIA